MRSPGTERSLEYELAMRELQKEVKTLETQVDLTAEKARQDLRKEILPLEQVPAVAESVSKMFHGCRYS
jgi:cell division protein FtsB